MAFSISADISGNFLQVHIFYWPSVGAILVIALSMGEYKIRPYYHYNPQIIH